VEKKVKAIGLFSGGLDSVLAAALMRKQGVEVIGLLVRTGFAAFREISNEERTDISDAADTLGITLRVADIRDTYWKTLLYPQYGYGKHMNPCMDCHLHMIRTAADVMREEHADFVFTGEVVGQRPKSQLSHQMNVILRESGIEDRLLRPLSALRLKPTLPEKEGWIDRSQLKGFFGRQRGPQLQLAKELGVEHLAVAAGGNCFLINEDFSRRFKDLLDQYGKEDFPKHEVPLLRIGRHFRISPGAKIVISRDEKEHEMLQAFKSGHYVFELPDVIGASGIGSGPFREKDMELAARLLSRYSKALPGQSVRVRVTYGENDVEMHVLPMGKKDPLIDKLRI
jgi:tRNA U34 2-thiouridine synthase MnmA/TrmU